MATEFQRMFGCPVCGFRIDESEPACPRCNNKFDSGTKFECPFCGELVDPRAKECPVCHVDYEEFKAKTKGRGRDADIDELLNEIIKLESMQAKQEPRRFSCPDCSWLLDGSESKCPKCGRDLTEEFAFQCPICGASVSADSRSCAECGALFEDEEVRAPPPSARHQIDELEDFAETIKSSPPEKQPEAPAITEPSTTPPPEEPAALGPPVVEAPAPEVKELERPVEVVIEQPTEAPPSEPTAPKSKKRKLKAKPSVEPP